MPDSLLTLLVLLCALGAHLQGATFAIDANVATSSATVTDNGGIYQTYVTGSGSGTYTDLFRIDTNSSSESGYNYGGSGTKPFDEKNGVGTFTLDLGEVPVVTRNGADHVQFLIDLNNNATITLTQFRVYIQSDNTAGNTTNTLVSTEASLGNLGTLAYTLDYDYTHKVALDNSVTIVPSSGSGTSDMEVDIPLSFFTSQAFKSTDNVYVYFAFTNNDSGFEELAIFKGATATVSTKTPEAQTVWAGASMALLLGGGWVRRRWRKSPELY